MEILNSFEHVETHLGVIHVIALMVSIAAILVAIAIHDESIVIISVCVGLAAVFVLIFSPMPETVTQRHEVLLRNDAIDATKYRVIEQRGEIFVIEEITK